QQESLVSPLFRFLCRAGLPLLALSIASQPLAAQPDDTPRTIRSPQNAPVGAPAVVPDPPLITPAELQTLTGGPTLVTFSGQDVPVKEVVQALLDAAKIPPSRFEAPVGRIKTLTVDWKEVPFWSAASEVEKQSGGYWALYGDTLSLVADQRAVQIPNLTRIMGVSTVPPSLNGILATQTPFVTIVANSLSRTTTRTTHLGEQRAPLQAVPDRTQLALSAYFDPKLKVRSVALRDLKFQERDNAPVIQGRQIRDLFTIRRRNGGTLISPQTVQIPAEITAGTTMARLSGVLHSEIIAASQTWTIPDLTAAPKTTRTFGANQYTLESAEIRDNQLTLRLSAQLPVDFSTFDSVSVRDAQGRNLPGGANRVSSQNAEFTFRFPEAFQGPYTLEWVIPTEVRSLDVPFELRDVPVP
ncbi:MAG: hypothetical protein KY445_14850, partial [Armatimonadetes bacterium]|nr:hypothetical protein [Armatimonadota bacterium]